MDVMSLFRTNTRNLSSNNNANPNNNNSNNNNNQNNNNNNNSNNNQNNQRNNQPQNLNGDNANNQNQNFNNQVNGNNQNPENKTQVNPLDSFSKMWDTPTTESDVTPSFTLDPKVLDTVSSQQDFMKGIPPELMQRAQGGDFNAMMEIMQHTTRNAYKSALEHSGLLTDKFVGAREAHNEKGFSRKVKGELTQGELANTPNYSHPTVRKQLTDIASKLQAQHPDASPQEIAQMSKDYLQELVNAINPPKDEAITNATKGPTDWDAYWAADDKASQIN